jgi:CubicO group peptidase (beta-lactamase class C family)
MSSVQGRCAPRFECVRRVFQKSFDKGEVGAAFAVTLGGEPVVDLFGGFADAARTRPWRRDTIVNVYSTTTGVTALCAHRLVEAGRLDLEAPVARYWPEFAQAGKERIPRPLAGSARRLRARSGSTSGSACPSPSTGAAPS